MATADVRRAGERPVEEKKKWAFPSAFTVLFAVTVLVWLLAFIIPTGAYKTTPAGRPIPGTYHAVDAGLADRPAHASCSCPRSTASTA